MTKLPEPHLPEPLGNLIAGAFSLGLERKVTLLKNAGQKIWNKEGCRAIQLGSQECGDEGEKQEITLSGYCNITLAQSLWKQPSVEIQHWGKRKYGLVQLSSHVSNNICSCCGEMLSDEAVSPQLL